ncbi:MAG TPA: hypothetical protein VHV32_07340 [Candidatus Angelobacter sp.]|jgi:hypothetical protein|nr:hypothetical protein [Candidatus Angelobacter sp.]
MHAAIISSDGSIADSRLMTGLSRLKFAWLLDLLLCAALLCMAGFLVLLDIEETRQLHAYRATSATPYDIPKRFQFIEGRDENGAFLSALPFHYRKLVFFVLHGSRFESDVAFWNAARANEPSPAGIGFVGVCDGPECSNRVASAGSAIHFISVNSGDYLAMKSLLRADSQRQVVIMDLPGGKLHKSAYPKSTGELAALQQSGPAK